MKKPDEQAIDKWAPLVAIVLVSLVAALIFYPSGKSIDEAAYAAIQKAFGWANGFTSEQWMAFFTGVLTLATLGTWRIMWSTLKATKGSVDAQINGQRGKLVFLKGRKEVDPSKGVFLVHSFQNIGGGRAMIKTFSIDIKPFGLQPGPISTIPKAIEQALPDPVASFDKEFRLETPSIVDEMELVEARDAQPGEKLNALDAKYKLNPEQDGALKNSKHLLIQYSVIYETAFGDFELRCAWTCSGTATQDGRRVIKRGYQRDARVK